MLAPDDLVDLGAALRDAGFKVSTQQLLAVQHLLLRLAAEGALPATRAALASWIGPVLCTSAAEQAAFGTRYGDWLVRRFGEVPAPEAGPAPPVPEPGRRARWIAAGLIALALAGGAAWWIQRDAAAQREAAQRQRELDAKTRSSEAAASAGSAAPAASTGAAGLTLVARFDLGANLPEPELADRLVPRHLAIAALPLVLYLGWLAAWLLRRPTLQRIASRTPPQLRDVHVPGTVRMLLPSLPLRRLAQELRRRRTVASRELQVEPTIAATLARGGIFTPVLGSRAEPDYLALVDRAGLADHQARLAGEVVAELARSDVLIDRHDFDRDARLVRSREAVARGGAARAVHAVELAELHERLPEHRVLVFSDGAGCFDGFTGEPMAWTLTLAAWPMPVLLTPVPLERWGRREWALQRLGIQVLPLNATGLTVLMGVVAGLGAPAAPAEPPAPAASGSHERSTRRWLERDPPGEAAVEQLLADLRADLGPRGMAWLCACAAYPEVHWGITLRLGVALVPAAAEFERLLPRLARLVWFRAAYLPDWLRERLLQELAEDDEAHARATLRALLEAVARGGDDVPLRIALGTPDTGAPWWRRTLARLRARGDAAHAQDLLRSAPPDSPLRDHVFLRFLSGAHTRRIDLRAPGQLLAALRAVPTARPLVVGLVMVLASLGLAWQWPVLDLGDAQRIATPVAFAPDSASAGVNALALLGRADGGASVPIGAATYALTRGAGGAWSARPFELPGKWRQMSSRMDILVYDDRGRKFVVEGGRTFELGGAETATGTTRIAPKTGHVAIATGARIQVWRNPYDAAPRSLDTSSGGELLDMAFSPDEGRLATVGRLGEARVWSLVTGESVRLPKPDSGALWQVGFSPDGSRVAASAGNRLHLWDSASGTARLEIPLGDITLAKFAWSPDGRFVVCWSETSGARLWRSDTGAPGASFINATGMVDLAFSPDGTRLAGIDGAGQVRLWDAATGQELGERRTTRPSPCCAASVVFSPDGSLLASSAGTEVALWSLPSPASVATRPLALLIGHDYAAAGAGATGVRDVRPIAAVLRERYGFDARVVENPSADEMLAALDRLVAESRADDRVILMLAGRAAVESGNFLYYATPPGRGPDLKADAVAGADIVARLARLPADQLLVLGDIGGLDALVRQYNATGVRRTVGARVLIAASSGSAFPFETPRGSIFALALDATLRAAEAGLTDRSLFAELSRRIAANDQKTGQRPAHHSLAGADASGGVFEFPDPLPSAAAPAAPASAASAAAPLAVLTVSVTAGGRPAPAVLLAVQVSGGSRLAVQTSANGTAVLRAPPGPYTLMVTAPGWQPTVRRGNLAAGRSSILLELQPAPPSKANPGASGKAGPTAK